MADLLKTNRKSLKGKPGPNANKEQSNKTTTALKEATIFAAAEHGWGTTPAEDGLKGYLRKVAREDVKAFSDFGRVLPRCVGRERSGDVQCHHRWR